MQISNFVNTIPSKPVASVRPNAEPIPPAGTPAPATAATQNVPSFITPASLVSVSGGTAVVSLLSAVTKQLFPALGNTPWVPFGCALFVGALIYLTALSDKDVNLTRTEKLTGVAIAFINSMVLFSAVKGIFS